MAATRTWVPAIEKAEQDHSQGGHGWRGSTDRQGAQSGALFARCLGTYRV